MQKNVNVDVKELKKFEDLSQHWWDLEGPLKTLHDINMVRINYIQTQLNKRPERILDLGCGGGILTESLYVLGNEVVGIDMAKNVVQVAQDHAAEKNLKIQYLNESAEQHAENPSNQYDLIVCMECLEHVPDISSIFKACHILLKPEGLLILSTINRTFKAFALGIVAAEHVLKIVPKNTHEYKKFIKPNELDEWLQAENLLLKNTQGLHYNPFTRQAKLSQDLSINYFATAMKSSCN